MAKAKAAAEVDLTVPIKDWPPEYAQYGAPVEEGPAPEATSTAIARTPAGDGSEDEPE